MNSFSLTLLFASNTVTIPVQYRVTQQIISRWKSFKDILRTFVVSRLTEQLRLHTEHRVVSTVEDSTLCVEKSVLESQEEDTPKRTLWYKPLGFLGVIRTHHRDESWSASL